MGVPTSRVGRNLTIGMSMLFVMAAAVCIAALRYSSPLVASLTFTATLTILLFSVIAAFFDRHKTFWIGFVVFGWGYALLAFAPGAWDGVRPHLLTTPILYILQSQMHKTSRVATVEENLIIHGVNINEIASDSWLDAWYATSVASDYFQRIGHSLAALVHGMVGGILAVILAARARRASEREDGRSPPSSNSPTS